jgi:hypothetical protein
MPYLLALVYVVMSGTGIPYALQAQDLVGRAYVTLAGVITPSRLLEEFLLISLGIFSMFLLLHAVMLLSPPIRHNRQLWRTLNSLGLALAGFASASLSLMGHVEVYGNTWASEDAFLAFVLPAWPAMLLILVTGGLLGNRLGEELTWFNKARMGF